MHNDEYWMKLALVEASRAFDEGEVPVGAVVVSNNELIAVGHNLRELENDPTAHAEIIALKLASKKANTWRLNQMEMYVTCEPCPMCAGALVNSRIKRVIFGCRDIKAGACGSLYNIVDDKRLNHRVEIKEGVLEKECSGILTEFFKKRRKENKLK